MIIAHCGCAIKEKLYVIATLQFSRLLTNVWAISPITSFLFHLELPTSDAAANRNNALLYYYTPIPVKNTFRMTHQPGIQSHMEKRQLHLDLTRRNFLEHMGTPLAHRAACHTLVADGIVCQKLSEVWISMKVQTVELQL